MRDSTSCLKRRPFGDGDFATPPFVRAPQNTALCGPISNHISHRLARSTTGGDLIRWPTTICTSNELFPNPVQFVSLRAAFTSPRIARPRSLILASPQHLELLARALAKPSTGIAAQLPNRSANPTVALASPTADSSSKSSIPSERAT